MEEEKTVEVSKGEVWIEKYFGSILLIVLCFLTCLGLIFHFSFRLYNGYISAVFATYVNGFVMIIWGIAVYYFVMIGKKILTRILLAMMAVSVWSGTGIGVYLIWKNIFWSIFGLPVVAIFIFVFFSLAAASTYDSGDSGLRLPDPPL